MRLLARYDRKAARSHATGLPVLVVKLLVVNFYFVFFVEFVVLVVQRFFVAADTVLEVLRLVLRTVQGVVVQRVVVFAVGVLGLVVLVPAVVRVLLGGVVAVVGIRVLGF